MGQNPDTLTGPCQTAICARFVSPSFHFKFAKDHSLASFGQGAVDSLVATRTSATTIVNGGIVVAKDLGVFAWRASFPAGCAGSVAFNPRPCWMKPAAKTKLSIAASAFIIVVKNLSA
jgi:TctA family transporter